MNLSEVVVREQDSLEDLKEKVKYATILGTIQSTLTDFRYLRKRWKNVTEEERLLGVSLTGIMDHYYLSCGPHLLGSDIDGVKSWLRELKQVAIDTNKEWSDKLGIPQSAAITCVKPSGTVSQLVNSASGIHPRYSKNYIRTVRQDKKDPLTQFLIDQGVPHEDDVMNPSAVVFSFPIQGPESSIERNDRTAIEQLEVWKIYAEHWCEHKPSVTIYVKEHEWVDVGAWVYRNFDILSGVSFLPYSDHTYQQAPYQEITEEEYNRLIEEFPDFSFEDFKGYEEEDNTTSSQELACKGGACEL